MRGRETTGFETSVGVCFCVCFCVSVPLAPRTMPREERSSEMAPKHSRYASVLTPCETVSASAADVRCSCRAIERERGWGSGGQRAAAALVASSAASVSRLKRADPAVCAGGVRRRCAPETAARRAASTKEGRRRGSKGLCLLSRTLSSILAGWRCAGVNGE